MTTKSAGISLLHSVQAGGHVWMDIERYSGSVSEACLYKISHVDKNGRLYISADCHWGKWRYGFDPETGKAHEYKFYTMRYASPEEIATEQERLAAIAREKAAEVDKRRAEERIRDAAPEMLVALCKIRCPDCDHELQHHRFADGCECELGDVEGDESGPAYALPPCGCSMADLSDDLVRAIKAIKKAKGAL